MQALECIKRFFSQVGGAFACACASDGAGALRSWQSGPAPKGPVTAPLPSPLLSLLLSEAVASGRLPLPLFHAPSPSPEARAFKALAEGNLTQQVDSLCAALRGDLPSVLARFPVLDSPGSLTLRGTTFAADVPLLLRHLAPVLLFGPAQRPRAHTVWTFCLRGIADPHTGLRTPFGWRSASAEGRYWHGTAGSTELLLLRVFQKGGVLVLLTGARKPVLKSLLLPLLRCCDPPGQKALSGLDRLPLRCDLVRSTRVGVIANHTATARHGAFITDVVAASGGEVRVLFAPEHGLFGKHQAGEAISNGTYRGIPVVSLYGKKHAPGNEALRSLDILLYDIQDTACRFYTYITTMARAMEAAGEAKLLFCVLDRPCLRGGTQVEGPLLSPALRSFVGYLPLPVAYAMTPAELARMACEENWLRRTPPLEVIRCDGWRRHAPSLSDPCFIAPSPNLPTLESVCLYPGTCLLEGTNLSEGRGTRLPFLTLGAPWIDGRTLAGELNRETTGGVFFAPIRFTPHAIEGACRNPKFKDTACEGVLVALTAAETLRPFRIGIHFLATVMSLWPEKVTFRLPHFQYLAGVEDLQRRLRNCRDPQAILAPYRAALERFCTRRTRYLLYPE